MRGRPNWRKPTKSGKKRIPTAIPRRDPELAAQQEMIDRRCSGPTERERLEMCGPDPVRNSDLGL